MEAAVEKSIKVYWDLFQAFFRPGVLTFGGGPSAIPLMQQEVVDKFKWLSVEEFTDALALGNSLPGPIATKMAALVGYKVAGWLGSVVSLLATVVPTALAIILLLNVYLKYKDASWMKGMMKGVRPVVVIMIAESVWTLSQKSFPSITTGIIAVVAIAATIFKVHPAILIITSLLFGGVFLK